MIKHKYISVNFHYLPTAGWMPRFLICPSYSSDISPSISCPVSTVSVTSAKNSSYFLAVGSVSTEAKLCHLSARVQVKKPGSRHRRTISTTSCVFYQGYSQVWCGCLAAYDFVIITSYVHAVQAARHSITKASKS